MELCAVNGASPFLLPLMPWQSPPIFLVCEVHCSRDLLYEEREYLFVFL